jgi:hypothetical protein
MHKETLEKVISMLDTQIRILNMYEQTVGKPEMYVDGKALWFFTKSEELVRFKAKLQALINTGE